MHALGTLHGVLLVLQARPYAAGRLSIGDYKRLRKQGLVLLSSETEH